MLARRMFIPTALTGLLVFDVAALAQQPARPVKPAGSPPAVSATQPGAATPPAPAIRRTETIAIDGWTVTCRETDAAKRACSAELRVLQPDANNQQRVIFNWIIGLNGGKPLTVFQVPTGILVQPGVEIRITAKELRRVPYTLCDQVKCEAALVMDDALIKDISAATTTDIVIQAVDGRNLTFGMNTKGFEKVLAEIRR
jgi:invasion protein IalB